MIFNLTIFCEVLNYNHRPIFMFESRSENMQVEATGELGKFCKLAFNRCVYNIFGGLILQSQTRTRNRTCICFSVMV